MTTMEACFQFHRWRAQTEPKLCVYRTWTEHGPNFKKYSEPEQSQTFTIKESKPNTNPKVCVLTHLYLLVCYWRR